MDVTAVNTVNTIGKWMSITPMASIANSSNKQMSRARNLAMLKAYRRPNVKRAFVNFMDHGYDEAHANEDDV